MKELMDFVPALEAMQREAAMFGHSIDIHVAPSGYMSVSFGRFVDEGELAEVSQLVNAGDGWKTNSLKFGGSRC